MTFGRGGWSLPRAGRGRPWKRSRRHAGLYERLDLIMATLEDVQAAQAKLADDFATFTTDVNAKVQELLALISAAGTDIPQAVVDKANEIDAAVTAADVAIKAVVAPGEAPPEG